MLTKSNTYTSNTAKIPLKVTRGWPPKRRAEQALRLRRAKIWLKSTGPKTVAGKLRVSQNAFVHGQDSKEFKKQLKITRHLLTIQRHYFKNFMKNLRAANKLNNKLNFQKKSVIARSTHAMTDN